MSLRSSLHGPPLGPPRPVDRALLWWAQQPPRMRLAVCALLLAAIAVRCAGAQADLQARWGGEGIVVWRATTIIPAGQPLHVGVEEVRLPPVAVPPDALRSPPGRDDRAVVPVFEGIVLVEGHRSTSGLADVLTDAQRLVAVPVDAGLGLEPGDVVDLWTTEPGPALLDERLAVQAVRGDAGRALALLVVDVDQVEALTAAMADGDVRLVLAGAGG